jgi:hypothetical protein
MQFTQSDKLLFFPAFVLGTLVVLWSDLYRHRSAKYVKNWTSSRWLPGFLGNFLVEAVFLAMDFPGGVAVVPILTFFGRVGTLVRSVHFVVTIFVCWFFYFLFVPC